MMKLLLVSLTLTSSGALRPMRARCAAWRRVLAVHQAHTAEFVLPTDAAAPLDVVSSFQADVMAEYLEEFQPTPLDLVQNYHVETWEDIEDQVATPLDLVQRFHEGLEREFAAADETEGRWTLSSLLRSPWSGQSSDVALA